MRVQRWCFMCLSGGVGLVRSFSVLGRDRCACCPFCGASLRRIHWRPMLSGVNSQPPSQQPHQRRRRTTPQRAASDDEHTHTTRDTSEGTWGEEVMAYVWCALRFVLGCSLHCSLRSFSLWFFRACSRASVPASRGHTLSSARIDRHTHHLRDTREYSHHHRHPFTSAFATRVRLIRDERLP